MKYYKDKNNEIYVYNDSIKEDDLNNEIQKLGLSKITDEELIVIKAQQDSKNHIGEQQEILDLKSYLNETNYIAINYGALRTEDKKSLFLETTSSTYNLTNEEIFNKRDLAIDRINELKEQLGL